MTDFFFNLVRNNLQEKNINKSSRVEDTSKLIEIFQNFLSCEYGRGKQLICIINFIHIGVVIKSKTYIKIMFDVKI